MDAVLRFMPPEERIQYSAMTGQSLFYMGETNLKHKILAIAEEEGAQQRQLRLEAAAVRRRTLRSPAPAKTPLPATWKRRNTGSKAR